MQGKKKSRKGKQRNKCRKDITGLNFFLIKIIKKIKEKKKEEGRKKMKAPQN